MKTEKQLGDRVYRYIKVSAKIYVNSEISVLKLPLLLFMKFKTGAGGRNALTWLLVTLKMSVKYIVSGGVYIEVPVAGHIAIPVSDGAHIKIFDLTKNEVSTVYSERFEEHLAECVRGSMLHPLYPAVLGSDSEHGAIAEAYYNGYQPVEHRAGRRAPDAPWSLLASLVERSKVDTRRAVPYYLDQLEVIERCLFRYRDWLITPVQEQKIREFTEVSYQKLTRAGGLEDVPLTFVHGDFRRQNLIMQAGQWVAIDWEYAAFRSPMFDTFFYLYNSFNSRQRSDVCTSGKCRCVLDSIKERREFADYSKLSLSQMGNLFDLEYICLRLAQAGERQFARDIDRFVIRFIDAMAPATETTWH